MKNKIKTGVSYFGNRYLAHAEKDLDQMSGYCDYVVHTFSETDFQYHKAALEKIFKATRRKGMEVWADPWGLGGVFGGEAMSKFLLDNRREWQVFSDGRPVPAACVNSPAFFDFLHEWTLTVLDLGAQVVFWDEPHLYFHWEWEWEGLYSCICHHCQAIFKREYGAPLPPKLTPEVRRFRIESLRGFLQKLMDLARRKKMKNALCLYAFEGHRDYEKLWETLAGIGSLDVFGCDPYWRWPPKRAKDPGAHVAHFASKVLNSAAAKGKDSQIWIQAMRFSKGKEGEILAAVHAAAQSGITHLAGWSYDGGALLDTVLAEDPSRVSEALAQAFKKLKP